MRHAMLTLLLMFGSSLGAAAEPPAPAAHVAGRAEFPITAYGATADDEMLDTAAIQKALDACIAAGGGTVVVPKGRFIAGGLRLVSNLRLVPGGRRGPAR